MSFYWVGQRTKFLATPIHERIDSADVNKLRGDSPGLSPCAQCNKCSYKKERGRRVKEKMWWQKQKSVRETQREIFEDAILLGLKI